MAYVSSGCFETPDRQHFGLEQYCCWDNPDKPIHVGQTHSFIQSLPLPEAGVGQMVLFAGAGLALLQTIGVAGLASEIADGLVEAVRQHRQLAAVTQGAGSAAWSATMLAAVCLLETEEWHYKKGAREDKEVKGNCKGEKLIKKELMMMSIGSVLKHITWSSPA